MQLADLASRLGVAIANATPVEVRGVAHDSRAVIPGDLFVCLVGANFDGHKYAADALARGAAAFCVAAGRENAALGRPAIVVPDTRAALPKVAVEVYDHPSRSLTMVGITGTNGKTTSTYLTASILKAAGRKTGTIGTLGAELMGEPIPSDRTTPEADQLQALLVEINRRGAEAVVMEVSSHALAQGRTDGTEYDAAIFTNLTQDHLDYHGTLDAYFQSKLRLFTDYPAASEKPFVAAVNLDDPRGREVAKAVRGRTLTYGVSAGADVRALSVDLQPASLSFTASTPSGEIDVTLNIGGAFQVYNALGALAAGLGLGIDLRTVAQGLADLKAVPGRFEAVPNDKGVSVVVDYAHTPDGLKNVLESARQLNPNRLIVVFGCGGDRDRTKRPIMGKLAGELADVAVVTSDNPRTEDPKSIIQEILPGLENTTARKIVEPDRRQAIAAALAEAQPGDILLIAGKGHEDYQEIAGVKHHFDDREVAREILEAA